jgi:sulfur carrier protein ThiS
MVKLVYRKKAWEIKPGMTARDAILKTGLKLYSVLPVRDGKLINEETILRDGDEIKLVAVVSGG